MLEYNDIKNISGYCYKNVTIELTEGTLQYNIASQKSLGIPETAYVLGIAARTKNFPNTIDDGVTAFSKNGLPLANPNLAYNAFVTIKDIETVDILSSHPLYSTTDTSGGQYFGTPNGYVEFNGSVIFFEPRRVCEIDWERSIVYFPPYMLSQIQYDFELVIIYYDPAMELKVYPAQTDVNNFTISGYRSKQIEIILRDGRSSYSLAKNSTIGIPDDCLVVGLGLGYYGNIANEGGGGANERKEAAFVTLKRGTTTFCDNFPVVLGNTINMPKMQKNSFNFLPLQALKAKDIDWEGSSLFISNLSGSEEGASAIFTIHYVQPVYKK